MNLLSRHILRSLAAPFFWGVVALTGLLLLNTLAQLIDSFGGKGLEWKYMVEAVVLALPALIVLTLPMAVLTATLYGFGQLAADMEMVAMYANGVSVWRIARPALIGAVAVVLVNFFLFDQFVPLSNASYRALRTAVANKNPTLTLRAGELNRIGTTAPYIMLPERVDSGGKVHGVTIYVLSSAEVRRVIRADSGLIRIDPNGRDMLMTLFHGSSMDFRPTNQVPLGRVEHTTFVSDRIRLRDVTNQFQLNSDLAPGDRELSSCQLLDGIGDNDWFINDGTVSREALTRRDLRSLTGLSPLPPAPIQPKPPTVKHCGRYRLATDWMQRKLLRPEAIAALVADSIVAEEHYQLMKQERAEQERRALQPIMLPDQPLGLPLNDPSRPPPDSAAAAALLAAQGNPPDSLNPIPLPGNQAPPGAVTAGLNPNDPLLASLPQGTLAGPPDRLPGYQTQRTPNDVVTTFSEVQGARQEVNGARRGTAAYAVEFHKKYAIPLSSLCFVLLGLALALQYPQGGIGLVIGGSLVIFMIFYILISAGENLAKKEFIDPALAMYGPLLIFTLLGLLAVASANREMGSARSGGLLAPIVHLFKSGRRRR